MSLSSLGAGPRDRVCLDAVLSRRGDRAGVGTGVALACVCVGVAVGGGTGSSLPLGLGGQQAAAAAVLSSLITYARSGGGSTGPQKADSRGGT